jgi:hypothetical protein
LSGKEVKKDKDPKKNADLELDESADLKLSELENNPQETADAGLSR